MESASFVPMCCCFLMSVIFEEGELLSGGWGGCCMWRCCHSQEGAITDRCRAQGFPGPRTERVKLSLNSLEAQSHKKQQ